MLTYEQLKIPLEHKHCHVEVDIMLKWTSVRNTHSFLFYDGVSIEYIFFSCCCVV